MPKDLSQNIVDKIKEKDVKPKPKWEFLLKGYLVWFAFGLTVISGALAVSVAIFHFDATDWQIRQQLGKSGFEFFLTHLPYIWIIAFAIFIILADYNLRHTEKGYKYSLATIIITSLASSIILGSVFYFTGTGKALDNALLKHIPPYQQLSYNPRLKIWSQPEKGLLAGEISKIKDESTILLIDFQNQEWEVLMLPKIPPNKLHKGMLVKTIGEATGESTFEAQDLRPWKLNFRTEDRFENRPKELIKKRIKQRILETR